MTLRENNDLKIFLIIGSVVLAMILAAQLETSFVIGTQFPTSRPVIEVFDEVSSTADEEYTRELLELCTKDCPIGYKCELKDYRYCEVVGVK